MTPEEIRQKKNQLVADMTNAHRELDAVRQQKREAIWKVEESFIGKFNTPNNRLNLIYKALELLQKACQYHRLDSFYGTCPDCNYHVPDTRRDGLKAHPCGMD
ncbi:MAG: hypothetical protein Q7S43_04415 [bacterium]|nr:hypothetical protein [bacterium]